MTYTNKQIAESWQLWAQYADPSATMTRSDFDSMSIDDRVAMLVECFGEDEPEDPSPAPKSEIEQCGRCGRTLDGFTGNWYDRKFYCPKCRKTAIAADEARAQEIRDLREQDIKRIVRERHCSRDEAAEISHQRW